MKKLKPNSLKKLFSVILSTIFLIGFNVIPANAATTVECSGGGYFTYIGTTVVVRPEPEESICAGVAIIPDTILTIGEGAFFYTEVTSVIIPNSVTTIEDFAFAYTPLLTSITIPNSVTTIGEHAFDTSGLTSVTIGNQVTTIEASTFEFTPFLTSITIPNSVTTIKNSAFYGSGLTSVTIGNQVTTIEAYAFAYTPFLTSINFLGNAPSTPDDAFLGIGTEATANVVFDATGFTLVDGFWKGLIVVYSLPPAGDSDSSTPKVGKTVAVEAPDAEIKVKNSKSLTKKEIKTMLDKKKTFKNYPIDEYKYSIFGTSKKICAINGNYVVALEKTGACEMWVTRTTAKGAKYKYWVKINYLK